MYFIQDGYLVCVLIKKHGCKSMVFTRTCESTRLLAWMLRNLGFKATPISGQMSQVHLLGTSYLFTIYIRGKSANMHGFLWTLLLPIIVKKIALHCVYNLPL